ncbi:MAG TPA: hypothetical protein VJU87_09695 [Gemmatimonadaceae bacterium]|nr:hypothetical protein [Gemmatimonadaceae bacterium]
MARTRRLTALLVSVLLAHLTWVASGFACTMPAMQGAASVLVGSGHVTSASMAGMSMPEGAERPSQGAPAHRDAPCRLPWTPTGCQSMAPCAAAAIASTAALVPALHSAPGLAEVRPVLMPPSETRAPELPPPRA